MTDTMLAARLHAPGEPFQVEQVPVPQPRHGEVLVRVAAAGLIPNMKAAVSGKLWYRLPPLPAIYGLDAAGTVERLGPGVVGVSVGDRVYVNPILGCGACPGCRSRKPMLCQSFCLAATSARGRMATRCNGPIPPAPSHSSQRRPWTAWSASRWR